MGSYGISVKRLDKKKSVTSKKPPRDKNRPDVGHDGFNDDEHEDYYGNVGPGDDRHMMAEDVAGDSFNYIPALRKAMEKSANRMAWEGLRVNSDGMPILRRMHFPHAMTTALVYNADSEEGCWTEEPVDWDDHDSVTTAIFPPDATVVTFGQRRSGKSYFTREAFYYLSEWYPRGIVFSDTDKMLRHYRGFVPSQYIVPKYVPEIQEAVNLIQKKIKEDEKLYDRMKEVKENFMRQFVVYDDCINKKGIFHYKAGDPLRRIFVNGRHYETLLWFNTQYPMAIPPDMRANVDHAFMFNADGDNERRALYELFGQPLNSERIFAGLLASNTVNYGILNVNNQQGVRRLVDRYSYYRAQPEPPPDFMMGDEYYQKSAQIGAKKFVSYPREAPMMAMGIQSGA